MMMRDCWRVQQLEQRDGCLKELIEGVHYVSCEGDSLTVEMSDGQENQATEIAAKARVRENAGLCE